MNYVYNATIREYYLLSAFNPDGISIGDPITLIMATSLDDVFVSAKKRSAIRARFAKEPQQGTPLLEQLAMTDDERDWIDEILRNCSSDILSKLSAWCKNIPSALRYNVNFGEIIHNGIVTAVNGAILTDSTKTYNNDELLNKKFVITSSGFSMNQEKIISGNTATDITMAQAYSEDVAGFEYIIAATTGKYVMYYLNLDLSWDLNLIEEAGNKIKEAFILYALKEWYLINRYADDYQAEEAAYQKKITEIRKLFQQRKSPAQRPYVWP